MPFTLEYTHIHPFVVGGIASEWVSDIIDIIMTIFAGTRRQYERRL